MPVTIENLTNRPVLLRFNSGQTRYLAPREALKDVMYVEVKSNAKIQKLAKRRVIELNIIDLDKAKKQESPSRKKTKATSTAKE
jgi:hypothetical protein